MSGKKISWDWYNNGHFTLSKKQSIFGSVKVDCSFKISAHLKEVLIMFINSHQLISGHRAKEGRQLFLPRRLRRPSGANTAALIGAQPAIRYRG